MTRHKAFVLINLVLCFQYARAQHTQTDTIRMVENGLISWATLDGEKDPTWTISERLAHYNVPGLSVAVIRNYKIAWAKAYGYADKESKTPVTTQTLFQAASISKSLNAAGILKLVQQGKIKLDQDINMYLKSWHPSADSGKITVANLLSHTAGLTVHGFEGYKVTDTLPTVVQILRGERPANSQEVKPEFAPGIRFKYSGGGTTITQLILTDVTGEKYDVFMQREVLNPYGMKQSFFTQPAPPSRRKQLATGYSEDGKAIEGKYHIHPEMAPAGLWTTPTDLCNFIINTQLAYEGKSSKVLTPEMTKTQLTPYIDKSAALGVFIQPVNERNFFSHSGANEGFRSMYYGSMDGGDGVVIMVNSDEMSVGWELLRSIGKTYGWEINKQRKMTTIAMPLDTLQQYAGTYKAGNTTIVCSIKENLPYIQVNDAEPLRAYFRSNREFFVLDVPMIIRIKDGTKGLYMDVNGAEFFKQ